MIYQFLPVTSTPDYAVAASDRAVDKSKSFYISELPHANNCRRSTETYILAIGYTFDDMMSECEAQFL